MSIPLRLSIMMFLQFFIWGAWYITIPLYMSTHGMASSQYWAYTAIPIGAMVAPFFVGLIADRFFNTERVLCVLFLLAGLSMLAMAYVGEITGTVQGTQTMIELFGSSYDKNEVFSHLITAHSLFFMPTLALTVSLSLKHLDNANDQFPLVRVWGTIGWIASGALILSLLLKGEENASQFFLGGGAAVILAIFSLTLPRTPAPLKGEKIDVKALFFVDAFKQLARPSFAVYMICSFLICIPLQAYYANLQTMMNVMDMPYIGFQKNLGTIVEALMLFVMPFFFRKLGIKKMITIGIGAWVLRYVLFALGASQDMALLVTLGILLHGICYDFFFVTGQIYVDKSTPSEVRGQAQSMNVFFTQGLGMYIGAKLNMTYLSPYAFSNPEIKAWDKGSLPYWEQFWWPLCFVSAVILVIFAIAFRYKEEEGDREFNH